MICILYKSVLSAVIALFANEFGLIYDRSNTKLLINTIEMCDIVFALKAVDIASQTHTSKHFD